MNTRKLKQNELGHHYFFQKQICTLNFNKNIIIKKTKKNKKKNLNLDSITFSKSKYIS